MPSHRASNTNRRRKGGGGADNTNQQRGGGHGEQSSAITGAKNATMQQIIASIDEQHNSDFPCSHHLRQVALQVIRANDDDNGEPNNSGSSSGGPLSLNQLVLEQILMHVSEQEQQAGAIGSAQQQASSASKNKKKRKRKKKKKNKASSTSSSAQQEEVVIAAVPSSGSVDGDEDDDDFDEEGGGDNSGQQQQQGPAAVATTTSPKAAELRTGDASSPASEVMVSPSGGACSSSADVTQAQAKQQQADDAESATTANQSSSNGDRAAPPPPSSRMSSSTNTTATNTAAAEAADATPTHSSSSSGCHRDASSDPATVTTAVVENPHWAFLHEFLLRNCATATNPSQSPSPHSEPNSRPQPGAATTNTRGSSSSPSSSLFWSRLLSQTCCISADRVKSYTSQIKCGICRASVESILEIETELVLSSTIPPTLTLPPCPTNKADDDDEHAFDYVAMEEGNGPGFFVDDNDKDKIPDDALVFALTAASDSTISGGHDNKNSKNNNAAVAASTCLAWQLRFHNNNATNEEEGEEQEKQPLLSQQNLAHSILMNYILGHGLSYEDIVATKGMAHSPSPGTGTSTNTGINNATVQSLRKKVDKACFTRGVRFFNECAQKLFPHAKAFKPLQNDDFDSNNNMNIADMSTFNILQEIDDGCTSLITEFLFECVWETTMQFFASSNVFFTFASHQNEDFAFENRMKETLLQSIWGNYLNIIETISNGITKYEGDLEGKVAHSREATLPAVFFSPTYRRLYRDFIQTKMTCTAKLITNLDNAFQHPVETGWPSFELGGTKKKADSSNISGAGAGVHVGGRGKSGNVSSSSPSFTTFRRRLFTQQIYFERQKSESRKEPPPADGSINNNKAHQEDQDDDWRPTYDQLHIDDAVFDFLKVINEHIETINRSSIKQIQDEHHLRNDRLQRRLTVVLDKFDGMVQELVTMSSSSSSSLEVGLANLLRELGDRAPTTTTITALTFPLLRYWIELRCTYKAAMIAANGYVLPCTKDMTKSPFLHMKKSPFLPTKLIKTMTVTMRSPSNNSGHHMFENEEDEDDHPCCSYNNNDDVAVANAKERAICILVCSYYQWMMEVYDEWRAEMAEQELLTTLMELEQQDSVLSSPNNKKQKQQVGGATAIVDNNNPSSPSSGNNTGKKKSKKKNKDKNKGTSSVSPKNGGPSTAESHVSKSGGQQQGKQDPRSEEEHSTNATKNRDSNITEDKEGAQQSSTGASAQGKAGEEVAKDATNTVAPVSTGVETPPPSGPTKEDEEREPSSNFSLLSSSEKEKQQQEKVIAAKPKEATAREPKYKENSKGGRATNGANSSKGTNASKIRENGSMTANVSEGEQPPPPLPPLPPPGFKTNNDNDKVEAGPPKPKQSRQEAEAGAGDTVVTDIDSFVSIGVYGQRNTFFSADEFLTARLVAVLNDEKHT